MCVAIRGRDLMKARKIVMLSIGFRLGIILLCFSLLYMHQRVFGQRYFNPSISTRAQRRAVKGTPNVDVRNDLGLTGLMFAAINGELQLAKALVQQGAHLNLTSRKGKDTALHFATNNMRAKTTRQVGSYLIDVYASTRLKNQYNDTPLLLTISTDVLSNWAPMVDQLIKNGADINAQTSQGDTLMHLVVNMKKDTWVKSLIDRYGSLLNMNIKNKQGWTPYQYARNVGFTDLARMLQGIRIRRITSAGSFDNNGLSGLMLAIMRNDQSAVQHMVKDVGALNERSKDQYQNSALHIALLFEDIPSLATLVKADASRTIKNKKGEIPLQYLVRINRPKLRLKAATLLLNNAPQTLSIQNEQGETLLHYIARYDTPQLLGFLIKRYKKYLDVSIQDKALQTPLELAHRLRRRKVAQMLAKLR